MRRLTAAVPALGVSVAGKQADLMLFDPTTVAERATFEEPFQYPIGIDPVIVNGQVVLDEGRHTNARPGKVLRRLPRAETSTASR